MPKPLPAASTVNVYQVVDQRQPSIRQTTHSFRCGEAAWEIVKSHTVRCNMDLSDASVGQLLIPVEDLDRGIAFYRDTLGMRFLFSAPPQISLFQCSSFCLHVCVRAA